MANPLPYAQPSDERHDELVRDCLITFPSVMFRGDMSFSPIQSNFAFWIKAEANLAELTLWRDRSYEHQGRYLGKVLTVLSGLT